MGMRWRRYTEQMSKVHFFQSLGTGSSKPMQPAVARDCRRQVACREQCKSCWRPRNAKNKMQPLEEPEAFWAADHQCRRTAGPASAWTVPRCSIDMNNATMQGEKSLRLNSERCQKCFSSVAEQTPLFREFVKSAMYSPLAKMEV